MSERSAELAVYVINCACPSCPGVFVRRNDLITNCGQGSSLVHSQKPPRTSVAGTGNAGAGRCCGGQSRLQELPTAESVGWFHCQFASDLKCKYAPNRWFGL